MALASQGFVLCADDFAQSQAIDDGILQLVAQHRLSAFSCLVLSPRWPQAACRITPEIRQQASVGLHLDFTQFSLHLRRPLPSLIGQALTRQLSDAQIDKSIQQQLDCFENGLQTPPDYIDGHQHVHQLPQIRDALVRILVQRYPHQKIWLRVARPPGLDLKSLIIRQLGSARLSSLAKQHGLPVSQTLLGVYAFNEHAAQYRKRFRQWLAKSKKDCQPVALMCHPAVVNHLDAHDPADPIFDARLQEFEYLQSPQFEQDLHQYAARLLRFEDISARN